MNIKLLSPILLIFLALNCQAQSVKKYFKIEEKLDGLFKKQAIQRKEIKKPHNDTYHLKIRETILNSYLEPYHLKTFDSVEVILGKNYLPSILLVSSYVNKVTLSQLTAFYKVAYEHKDKIQFFMLYSPTSKHDSLFKKYSSLIHFIPVNIEKSDKDNLSIKVFTHLGMPTTFMLNKDRRFVDFFSGALMEYDITLKTGEKKSSTAAEAFQINYNKLKEKINLAFPEKQDN